MKEIFQMIVGIVGAILIPALAIWLFLRLLGLQ